MALLHPSSAPAAVPELNIFSLPPTQTAIDNAYFVDCRPVSQVMGNHAPVEFSFGGEGPDYIDLSRSKLKVKFKIVHQDATSSVLEAAEVAVPINLALHSLWSQVDVTLGGRLMTQATGMYPFKAFIQTLLNYGKEAKESQLLAQGWYEEGADLDAVTTAGNSAVFQKETIFKTSNVVDLEGALREDIFHMNRYLLNNIDVTLKLYPSHPEFFVMGGGEDKKYKVVFDEVLFKVCMIKVSPGVILGHAKALETRNALYPFNRVETKSYSIPKGIHTINLDNVFQQARPSRLVFGLVSADAFNGDYKKNPFRFQHFDVTDVAVVVNGETVPGRPLKLNFETAKQRDYISGYLALFEGTGRSGSDFGNGITPKEYAAGHTLYVYNLDPEFKRGKYLNLVKRANVRLELRFAKPLPETVNVVVYAEHPSLFEVDRARNIISQM
jgi:hypothetical protein